MSDSAHNNTSSAFLKTDIGKTKSNAIDMPSISLPKGGGAMKGIDEKFTVNAVNGTSSFSIPIPIAASRNIAPALSITYNSGSGNSVFGLGWALTLGTIKRKTDRELPQYLDESDTDTFLFSQAEDLVPEFKRDINGVFVLDADGEYVIYEDDKIEQGFVIRYYRPRIEGLFARIERWFEKANGRIKWRIVSRENVTTLYGWTDESILFNPEDPLKIVEWYPEFVFDGLGNSCHLRYKREDDSGRPSLDAHQRNRVRDNKITYTNLYLTSLLYGNKVSYLKLGDPFPQEGDYLFRTVLDYGSTDKHLSPPDALMEWDYRNDAFSDYRAGFEIRTTRLCKRILLFHVMDELAVKADKSDRMTLVRSLDFGYDTSSEQDFTYLKSFTSIGYIKRPNGSYSFKQLPPMEFNYQKHEWNKEVSSISMDDIVNVPVGLDEKRYQFVDLYNEGLSGILTEESSGLYYKRNLGGGTFSKSELISPKPSFEGLGIETQLSDLDADGGKQLLSLHSEPKGFFELNDQDEWLNFVSFNAIPNLDLRNSNVRFIDLNGDGMPDLVVSEDNVLLWYQSEGRKGYSPLKKSLKSFDEEDGPSVVFSDIGQSIYLADMTGDGLTDIVRIRNGDVCYWPNLGHGKFGSKVTMDNSPLFDHPESFNPVLLRLADIDGSGTADIIYLGKNKLSCWKNLSGNRFSSDPFELTSFPEIHNQSAVTIADILGNGLSCIVWSSSLPDDTQSPLKYIDLLNSKKPHIMVSYKNNMGKEVQLEYQPSTKYYLDDKKSGKSWVTKLHFPIHCVSKTVVEDKISGYAFVKEYKYHHGYYDHAEREFRGFAMVEEIDAETFEHWIKRDSTNITEDFLHQEPVHTRSWQHTGALIRNSDVLSQYADDYWYAEINRHGLAITHHEMALADAKILIGEGITTKNLTIQERQEAYRACKGFSLRKEVFAKDAVKYQNTEEAKEKEQIPYAVSTQNCVIEMLQPKGKNNFAVFLVKESEAISYSYERNAQDPRISHHLNIKSDKYGNVLESASVVYPRQIEDSSLPEKVRKEQTKTYVLYSRNRYTNDLDSHLVHQLRLPSEVETFELTGVNKSDKFYSISDFDDILSDAKSIPLMYQDVDTFNGTSVVNRRLVENLRTLYYRSDLKSSLPLHHLNSPALTFESFQLAFTPDLLVDIFGTKVSSDHMLEGKFEHNEGDNQWWIKSGRTQFVSQNESAADAHNRFYSPISYTDAYGAITSVSYYKDYFLFIDETVDPFGNRTTVMDFNFRTLSPGILKDINGNISEAISDELGLIKAIAVKGSGDQADELTGYSETTEEDELSAIENYIASANSNELEERGKQLLKRASVRYIYNFDAYRQNDGPAVVSVITRERHYADMADSSVQIVFEYSNGMGEVIMKKIQSEPGTAKKVLVSDDKTISVSVVDTGGLIPTQLRWIGNGRTIKNNKGNAVKQYESYFSDNWKYEDYKELVETGVTPLLQYDAIGRLVKTIMPDGTFSKIEFDSWRRLVFDSSDTCLDSDWYKNRISRSIDAELLQEGKDPEREKLAAEQSSRHANTPLVLHYDTLGRDILSVQHNRNIETNADEFYYTYANRDCEGNLRSVVDANGNRVVLYKYDMLGNVVYQTNMDAGQRWVLNNILNKPLRTWDERDHEFRYFYDIAQRPTYGVVVGGDGTIPLNHIFSRVIYGEDLLASDRSNESVLQSINVLGKVVKQFDTAGLVETSEYDFKGNALSTTRKLLRNYKDVANWIDDKLIDDLEDGQGFTFQTKTDALGRITEQIAPDGSLILPKYDRGRMLKAESIIHVGTTQSTEYIKSIEYNEKGQRVKIVYGNNTYSDIFYDRETFKPIRLLSKRLNNDPLQDWSYTYDATGNITHIEDRNIPVTFFDNQKITGLSAYTYDAIYRLVEATGRENTAALNFGLCDNWNDKPFMHMMSAGDPMSARAYTEHYRYDAVGNFLQMKHIAMAGNWTRGYEYENNSNRLKKTFVGDNPNSGIYTKYAHHEKHGFLKELPHLEKIEWNFKEEVVLTSRQHCTDDNIPVITYYQYDGSGQRIRKITENQSTLGNDPTIKEERVYISGYEFYKKHSGVHKDLERVSLSLLDDGHRFVTIETRNNIDDGSEKKLVRYQLHNHIGSASLELDDTARVVSYEEYHPFGTTAYQAVNKDIKSSKKRYRFTGMERDEETGMEYHSARYYLPWLGRWLSCDPIGIGDGVNVYQYAKNSPIIKCDKSGNQADMPDAHIGGDIGELSLAQFFDSQDDMYEVVYDATKSGSQHGPGGFDMIVLDKTTGQVMIIDNKAYQSTIKGVSAFEPGKFEANMVEAIDEVYKGSSGYTDEIIEALESGNIKRVVSNSFSSGNVGFSGDVFNEVDEIFDVRTGGFYKSIDEWKSAADAWKASVKATSPSGKVGSGRRVASASEAVTDSGKIVTNTKVPTKLLATLGSGAIVLKAGAAYAGPVGDAVEIAIGANTVMEAPPEQRAQVAKEETLGIGFGMGGAALGGLAVAAVCSTGWGCVALGVLAVGGGGLGGDAIGRGIAKSDGSMSIGREDANYIYFPGEMTDKRTGRFQLRPGPKY